MLYLYPFLLQHEHVHHFSVKNKKFFQLKDKTKQESSDEEKEIVEEVLLPAIVLQLHQQTSFQEENLVHRAVIQQNPYISMRKELYKITPKA